MDTIEVLTKARKLVAESWNPIPRLHRTKPEETIKGKYCVEEAIRKVSGRFVGTEPAKFLFIARFELTEPYSLFTHEQTLQIFDRAIELVALHCPSNGQAVDNKAVAEYNG